MPELVHHVHGKNRVRLARTWREGAVHHFVEWMVEVIIESDMEHAYKTASNAGMTTTDTTKNQCYVVAKKMAQRCSPEQYCVALGKQFLDNYPLISAVEVKLEEKPWSRVDVMGKPHDHGYSMQGPCTRTAGCVSTRSTGAVMVTSGMKEFKVLKTTQSGYEGYLKDQFTVLPPTKERVLATSLDVQWTYVDGAAVGCYNKVYGEVAEALKENFFGPPKGGVYSPSMQYTVYQMGAAVVERVVPVQQVTITAPNIHFIPMNNPTIGVPFADDVYVATSEPHGNISATISKDKVFRAISKL